VDQQFDRSTEGESAQAGASRYPNLERALAEGKLANLPKPERREPRCGPWDEIPGGMHKCRQCGRLDPLDFIEDVA
jgi:hypothetical protein